MTTGRTMLVAALLVCGPVARAQMSPGGMGGGMGGMGGAPPSGKVQEDLIPEVDASVAADALKTWERGEAEFAKHNWLDAIAYYRHVMQKFSFNVALAAKSELRLGDVAFERGRFAEARGYYRNFLRFHPRHERADYAAFRVGLCAFKDIPGDLFIEPPSEEKDQTEAKTALAQMRDFLEHYSKSEHVTEAREIVTKCEDKLAAHELYVARFYARREKWKGTVLRTEGLVKTYPHSTLAAEALAMAVEGHAHLGEGDEARRDLETLEALQPPQKLLDRARQALSRLP